MLAFNAQQSKSLTQTQLEVFLREQIASYITQVIDNPKCHALALDDIDDRATLLKLLLKGVWQMKDSKIVSISFHATPNSQEARYSATWLNGYEKTSYLMLPINTLADKIKKWIELGYRIKINYN